jgi:hypothetical protein
MKSMNHNSSNETFLYPLTLGYYAYIDIDDLAKVRMYKWRVQRNNSNKHKYATTLIDGKNVLMHRYLLGLSCSKHVDHKNNNGLDNRKANIRVCTRAQNQQNKGKGKNNTSGYCGVWMEQGNRLKPWRAMIRANGRKYLLGYHQTAQEAALAYDRAAIKLHGEYAKLNF